MANSEEFVNHVLDLMAPLGDVLDLRADDENRAEFEAAGMERAGKMPYYRAPPEALEDGEVFLKWAEGAVAASQRAAQSKSKSAKPKRAPK